MNIFGGKVTNYFLITIIFCYFFRLECNKITTSVASLTFFNSSNASLEHLTDTADACNKCVNLLSSVVKSKRCTYRSADS